MAIENLVRHALEAVWPTREVDLSAGRKSNLLNSDLPVGRRKRREHVARGGRVHSVGDGDFLIDGLFADDLKRKVREYGRIDGYAWVWGTEALTRVQPLTY